MPTRFAPSPPGAPCWLCLAGAATAQQVPNAGAILRQLEPDVPPPPAPKADQSTQGEAESTPSGPPIHVSAFRLTGNERIRTSRIEALLAPYVNRDLTPAQLREATDAVARLYRAQGWL